MREMGGINRNSHSGASCEGTNKESRNTRLTNCQFYFPCLSFLDFSLIDTLSWGRYGIIHLMSAVLNTHLKGCLFHARLISLSFIILLQTKNLWTFYSYPQLWYSMTVIRTSLFYYLVKTDYSDYGTELLTHSIPLSLHPICDTV